MIPRHSYPFAPPHTRHSEAQPKHPCILPAQPPVPDASIQAPARPSRAAARNCIFATGALLSMTGLAGCSFSPSVNLLGSYFPAWILCCMIAIACTAVTHMLFSRWKLLDQLWPTALLYPCLICFVSCVIWLVFFR